MNYVKVMVLTVFLMSNFVYCQDKKEFTTLKLFTSDVKIPGNWELIYEIDGSGQTYLKNEQEIILTIVHILKEAYPTFKKTETDFENLKLFYKWGSMSYFADKKFKTKLLKENPKNKYIIWKYNDIKFDTVVLDGLSEDNFIILQIYTDKMSENEKITFLKKLYKLNKW